MTLAAIELWLRWLGAVAVVGTLAVVLWGLWQSLKRPKGRETGLARWMLRGPVYLLGSIAYFGVWYLLWRPLPVMLPDAGRAVALALGALLFYPGVGLVLWGRLTLGEMYNVSSALGAQLYPDQRLVTRGPFAIVRHPMYLGIMLAAVGGVLVYRTWTCVFTLTFFGLVLRARREEQALTAEFGEDWEAYCRRVPAWIPRVRLRRD